MQKTLVIAEAGVNHNANIDIAKKLIDAAKAAGADIVKFQTAVPELVVTAQGEKAKYQKDNTGNHEESQLEMTRKIHLPLETFYDLKQYADKVGIKFLSTAFDMVSLDLLHSMNLGVYKIPSGEITNLPYLQKIGSYSQNIILSTGMSNMNEIAEALSVLEAAGTPRSQITVLHCTTSYPARMKDVNLLAMRSIGEEFGVKYGYSDHTLGLEIPVAAVALGACVIEKHFTLSRAMEGPDHAASLEPNELKEMVRQIRNVEVALGSGAKKPTETEIEIIPIARRSIHLAAPVKAKETLEAKHFVMLRPGDGISPMEMHKYIGKKVTQDLPKNHKLSKMDIESEKTSVTN